MKAANAQADGFKEGLHLILEPMQHFEGVLIGVVQLFCRSLGRLAEMGCGCCVSFSDGLARAGFSVDEAANAKFVTIVGSVNGVREDVQSKLKWLGSRVERVAGKDSAETGQILNDLVAKRRRFLTIEE